MVGNLFMLIELVLMGISYSLVQHGQSLASELGSKGRLAWPNTRTVPASNSTAEPSQVTPSERVLQPNRRPDFLPQVSFCLYQTTKTMSALFWCKHVQTVHNPSRGQRNAKPLEQTAGQKANDCCNVRPIISFSYTEPATLPVSVGDL